MSSYQAHALYVQALVDDNCIYIDEQLLAVQQGKTHALLCMLLIFMYKYQNTFVALVAFAYNNELRMYVCCDNTSEMLS